MGGRLNVERQGQQQEGGGEVFKFVCRDEWPGEDKNGDEQKTFYIHQVPFTGKRKRKRTHCSKILFMLPHFFPSF